MTGVDTTSESAALFPGDWLSRLDAACTVLFVAVTLLAGAVGSEAVAVVNLVVCAALFLIGSALWTWGFLKAAGRSRDQIIDLAGLFYLTGSAPRRVRRWLLGLWFAQIATAVASIPLTSPPFGVMVPVFGIGVLTLWAATRGTFPDR